MALSAAGEQRYGDRGRGAPVSTDERKITLHPGTDGEPRGPDDPDPEAVVEAIMAALEDSLPAFLAAAGGAKRLAQVVEEASGGELPEEERSFLQRTLARLRQTEAAAPTPPEDRGEEKSPAAEERAPETGAARPGPHLLTAWIQAALRDERVKALARGDGALPPLAWEALCVEIRKGPLPAEARSGMLWSVAEVAGALGSVEGRLSAAQHKRALDRERGDDHGLSRSAELAASILERQGRRDLALSIRMEDVVPALERTGEAAPLAKLLSQIGDQLYHGGKLEEALFARRRELALREELGQIVFRAVVRTKIADVLMARGANDEALRIYRDALRTLETQEDPRNQAITLNKIARLLTLGGKQEEALRLRREREIPIHERLGDDEARATAASGIADALMSQGRVAEALRVRREEELPIHERLGDDEARATAASGIADALMSQGRVAEALRVRREEELPIHERLGDTKKKAATLGAIADALFILWRDDEALAAYKQVAEIFKSVGDTKGLFIAESRISDVLERQGRLDEAQRRRHEELAAVARAGDEKGQAILLAKIGQVLHKQGKGSEALAVLQGRALPVFQRFEMLSEQAHVLLQIGRILLGAGKPTDALRSCREALQLVQRAGDLRVEGIILHQMADAYRALGKDDEALRVLTKEAAPLLRRSGNVRERVSAMVQAAAIHEARRQLDAAVRILKEEVVAELERIGDEQGLIHERARLALACLKRNAHGDRPLARELLRRARAAAEARRMPYAQEIRKMQKLFKLEPS
jgi:tetratricopeptide (TPR) repeat protein